MDSIFCPKCKTETGLAKDRSCKTRWRCPECDECCIVEKKKEKKN